MRKITALIGVASIVGLALTGCSSGPSAGDSAADPVTASDYNLEELDYELPDGSFVKCLAYRLGGHSGTLTCEPLEPNDTPKDATLASEDYKIVYVTSARGDELTCLDYNGGSKSGVFACVPSSNR